MLSTLQQLQQSDPKYQQATKQIAANLQSAAAAAQSQGNSHAATQLTQLANDFTEASKKNQLPNLQDLANAIGGHHHRHHSAAPKADSDGDADSTQMASMANSSTGGSSTASASSNATGSASSGSASQAVSRFLSALESNSGSQSARTNPMSIILNTLSSAGRTGLSA